MKITQSMACLTINWCLFEKNELHLINKLLAKALYLLLSKDFMLTLTSQAVTPSAM